MLAKRGQVTMFMILGIVVLISFGLVIILASNFTKESMQTSLENTQSGIYGNDGLKIYVEDCLEDTLEEGLIELGAQGRLWEDDYGGSLTFLEGENGVNYGADQIYYALTHREDWDYPNSYPCEQNNTELPAFCMYSYPEEADFGNKENLKINSIMSDLSAYVKNQSAECVETLLAENKSIYAEVKAEDNMVDLDVDSTHILGNVIYKIEIPGGEGTYHHVENFDFRYDTKLRSFLTSAITTPLYEERRNVSYGFNETNLNDSNSYRSLSPTFTNYTVPSTGDTIIHYWLDAGKILRYQPYEFQFAIENRPPALNYISRNACNDYDYLVISGDSDLKNIEITMSANDPDDDSITYSYLPNESFIWSGVGGLPGWEFGQDYFYAVGDNVAPDIYEMRFNATDQFGNDDWQDVRILVDRPIEMELTVATPYEELVPGGVLTVSREDPLYVTMTFPSQSDFAEESLTLNYDNRLEDELNENWSAVIPVGALTESEVALPCLGVDPSGEYDCSITEYSGIIDDFDFYADNYDVFFYFSEPTYPAELTLDFSAAYCSEDLMELEEKVYLDVKECVPYENPEHPYPYVPGQEYHNIYVDPATGDESVEEIDPFLATHVCCDETGSVRDTNYVCLDSGNSCTSASVEGWGLIDAGYWQVTQSLTCDGTRGNVCGGEGASEYGLIGGTPTCGETSMDECSNIATDCEGAEAWSFVDTGSYTGWCHGNYGCQEVCDSEVVYVGDFNACNYEDNCDIFVNLNSNPINDEELGYVCGCNHPDVEDYDPCDPTFDGYFEGACMNGVCVT